MSGVYIRNMEMPKECQTCVFARLTPTGENIFCCIAGFTVPWADNKRSVDCPLVEVPDHGDLIDAQEQMRLIQRWEYDTYNDYSRAFDMLDDAPTIIPADKEDDDGET